MFYSVGMDGLASVPQQAAPPVFSLAGEAGMEASYFPDPDDGDG